VKGEYILKDPENLTYLEDAEVSEAFVKINEIAPKLLHIPAILELEEEIEELNKSVGSEDNSLAVRKNIVDKELKVLLAEQEEVGKLSSLTLAVREACILTIDELAKDNREYTMEEIQSRFESNIHRTTLGKVALPMAPGAKAVNNMVNKMDGNMFAQTMAPILTGTAVGVGTYHVLRGLFNLLPANPGILGRELTEQLTKGNTLIDAKNLPLLIISIGIGAMAHQYMAYHNRNMSTYKNDMLGGSPTIRDVFFSRRSAPMYLFFGSFAFMQVLDIAGSTATIAASERKEEQKELVIGASNDLATTEHNLEKYLHDESAKTYEQAKHTIEAEANAGGAGPITAQKIERAFVAGGETYNSMMQGKNRLPSFDAGAELVPAAER